MATRRTPPKERLSRAAIVDRALQVADAEGLDAVTIRRIAGDHGVTPMALYWHFKDKEELLDGVAERLFSEVELAGEPSGTWEERFYEAQRALLKAMRAHPNAAELALNRVLESEAGLMVAEHTLGLLRQRGFSVEEAAEIGTFLICSITALVTGEPGPSRSFGADREAHVRAKRAYLTSLPPEIYPNVIASTEPLIECRSEETYFSRGLDMLVGGIVSLGPVRG